MLGSIVRICTEYPVSVLHLHPILGNAHRPSFRISRHVHKQARFTFLGSGHAFRIELHLEITVVIICERSTSEIHSGEIIVRKSARRTVYTEFRAVKRPCNGIVDILGDFCSSTCECVTVRIVLMSGKNGDLGKSCEEFHHSISVCFLHRTHSPFLTSLIHIERLMTADDQGG